MSLNLTEQEWSDLRKTLVEEFNEDIAQETLVRLWSYQIENDIQNLMHLARYIARHAMIDEGLAWGNGRIALSDTVGPRPKTPEQVLIDEESKRALVEYQALPRYKRRRQKRKGKFHGYIGKEQISA